MPKSELIMDIVILLLFALGIYWLGRHEHARVSKHSIRKFIHGRYLPEWVALGFLTPALAMYVWSWPQRPGAMGPMILASFGLLIGLGGGWIHGGIRLLLQRPDQSIELQQTRELPQRASRRVEDGNPFRPPQED